MKRLCKYCGKDISDKRVTAKFCCNNHRNYWRRKYTTKGKEYMKRLQKSRKKIRKEYDLKYSKEWRKLHPEYFSEYWHNYGKYHILK